VFVRAQHGELGVQLEKGLTDAAKDVLESLHASISPKQVKKEKASHSTSQHSRKYM
jgi:hypothetical protein